MADRSITIKILGDSKDAQRAFTEVENKVAAFGDKVQGFGKKMAKIGAGLTAGLTLPIAGIFKAGFDELQEGEKVAAQTSAVLKSTGASAWVTADGISELAQKLSDLSGVDDEVIQASENMLLTFANVQNAAGEGNDIFNQATASALDMSVALGEDASASAMRLGKALNDPIAGVSALRKVGVQLSDAQEQQVKDFMAVNDIVGAQKVIIGELNKEFGGSASAFGNTTAGKIEKLKNKLADVAATLAEALMPAIEQLGDWLGQAVEWFQQLSPEQQKWGGIILACVAALGPLVSIIGVLVTVVGALISPVGLVIAAIVLLAAGAYLAYQRFDWFRSIVDTVASFLRDVFTPILGFFQDHWDQLKVLLMVVGGILAGALLAALIAIVSQIALAIAAVTLIVGAVLLFIQALQWAWEHTEALRDVLGKLASVATDAVVTAFNAVRDSIGWVIDKLQDLWDKSRPVRDFLADTFRQGLDALRGAFDAVRGAVDAVWDAIQRVIDAAGSAIDLASSIPTPGDLPFGLPSLPSFDVGGFVPGPIGKPMLAVVHGGEYVNTTDEVAAAQTNTIPGMAFTYINNASTVSAKDVADEFAWHMKTAGV